MLRIFYIITVGAVAQNSAEPSAGITLTKELDVSPSKFAIKWCEIIYFSEVYPLLIKGLISI